MQKMNYVFKKAQSGFTLIELVVVIVILGILAATALPKFSSLGGDARGASAKAAEAALKSVSTMAHSKFLIAGSPSAADTNADFEGITVVIDKTTGYPKAAQVLYDAAGLSSTDYTVAADFLTVTPKGAPAAAVTAKTCTVTYTPGTGVVSSDISAC